MIVTLTLNPAIDMNYRLDHLVIDQVNRCDKVIKTAGGKGLNVTRVLKCAGEPVLATGFLGGKTGEFIQEQLNESAIENNFVPISGRTRHCLALMHEGNQTEILESGPEITADEASAFLRHFEKLLDQADVFTASGSVPKGLQSDFYAKLIRLAKKKNKKFLLDTNGESLLAGIEAGPTLIKPNEYELAGWIGHKLSTDEEIINAAFKLSEQGIEYVVVSLGAKGAIACVDGKAYQVALPKVKAVNPVGSGDSMLAGLALGISRGYSAEKTLAYGACFGTLNAMEDRTGFIDKDKIDQMVAQIAVSEIAIGTTRL